MTANEMADELELQADRNAAFGSPGYEDKDLTSVFTDAETLYVKKFVDKKNNRKGEGLDETEIRSQGLSALIKRGAALSASTSQVGVMTNGQFFDLPTDFMYCIHEECSIDQNDCNDNAIEVDVVPIGYDEVSRFRKNKYKKPYYTSGGEGKIWRLVTSRQVDGFDPAVSATAKRHELVTDGTFNVSTYSINYLQNPKGITVDRTTVANQRNCILDESTHRVIIDIALSLLMDRVKEQELKNIESLRDIE
jgi:hypothetical protein